MSEADNRMEELANRVERASGPLWTIDQAIAEAIGWTSHVTEVWTNYDVATTVWTPPEGCDEARWPAYTASLDAAMSLVPKGWNWMAGNRNQPTARAYVENGEPAFAGAGSRANPRRQWFEVVAATPALALTAASLRARALTDPRP